MERSRVISLLRVDPALSRFDYYVGPEGGQWVGVYPRLIVRGPKVAKSLSKHLKTHAFTFRTFGEGALLYEYYRNGERHDRYTSSPDAVRRMTDMDTGLAEIVEQWEEGMLSAVEYRRRIDGYLATHDDMLKAVKEQAAGALRGVCPAEAARVAADVVYEVIRGAKADRVVREALDRRFADPDERRRAHEAFEALLREGAAGGDPRAYQELFSEPGGVETVSSLLHAMHRGGAEILRELGKKLGMSGVELSFQRIDGLDGGFERISPEEE